MKKGDIIQIKEHDCYSDVLSGHKPNAELKTHGPTGFPLWYCRIIKGGDYRFIHMTNSDTAFVQRLGGPDWLRDPFYDSRLILVKIDQIIKNVISVRSLVMRFLTRKDK